MSKNRIRKFWLIDIIFSEKIFLVIFIYKVHLTLKFFLGKENKLINIKDLKGLKWLMRKPTF